MSERHTAPLNDHAPPPDAHLPGWARRGNPLVRYRLGAYWRAAPLEIRPVLRILAVQIVLIALSALLPLLNARSMGPLVAPLLLMPVAVLVYGLLMAALLVLPVLLLLYGRMLVQVGAEAMRALLAERQGETLTLLRTTPPPLTELLLSLIAAGIWRRADALNWLLRGAVLLGLPPVALTYALLLPPTEYPLWSRLGMVAGLVAALLRPLLELLMAGALGVVVGASADLHVAGTTWVTVLLAAYFTLLNLPRLLPLSLPVRLLLELVVPLVLPVLVTWGALKLAGRIVRQA